MNTHLKKNQAPGSYIYTGDKLVDTQITHVVYNEQTLEVRDDLNFDPRFNHWFRITSYNVCYTKLLRKSCTLNGCA